MFLSAVPAQAGARRQVYRLPLLYNFSVLKLKIIHPVIDFLEWTHIFKQKLSADASYSNVLESAIKMEEKINHIKNAFYLDSKYAF